jgi:AhpC/TSA family
MAVTASLGVGDRVPDFTLPDTEGMPHTLDEGSTPATAVLVTCNHCPYALAWHDRLMAVARDYEGRGVRFLAMCGNDADRYPRDSLEAMRRRVREERWPMPYLHDATQEVLRSLGATVTPEIFVVDADRRLRYHGAPDSSHDDPGQNARWLRDALDAVLAGREAEPAETRPVGCSIKWRQGA